MNTKIRYSFILLIAVLAVSFKVSSQTTYTWNGSGSSMNTTAKWNVASNWIPSRTTPGATDILLFNSGGNKTVSNIPTETIGQIVITNSTNVSIYGIGPPPGSSTTITIGGLTGNDLVIDLNSALKFEDPNGIFSTLHIMMGSSATASISGAISQMLGATIDAQDAGAIVFHSGSVFSNFLYASPPFTSSGMPDVAVFEPGSSISTNSGAGDFFGLAAPDSKIVLMPGSNFTYSRDASCSPSGRTYGNVTFGNYNGGTNNISGPYPFNCDNFGTIKGVQLNVTGGVNIRGNIVLEASGGLLVNPSTPSTLNLIGTTLQTISGFQNTVLFGTQADVVVNNPAGVTVIYGSNNFISDITLYKSLTLQQGVFKFPPQSKLTLAAGATVTGASSSSFVDGKVKKIGNTAFTFPVGKDSAGFKGYAPISISAPANVTDAFTATYVRKPATDLSTNYAPGLNTVSPVDFWNLDRTTGTSTVDVTLGWTAESVVGNLPANAANLPNLVNAHYNGSSLWDSYGGVLNAGSNSSSGSVTRFAVNTFSPFALGIAPSGGPLPIILSYLNGVKDNGKHNLEWLVNCYNSAGATMQLERSSNGRNFNPVYNITATATRCLQPFNYTDAQPLDGYNYYRLKITDNNGPVTYSEVIVLINKNTGYDMVLQPTIVTNTAVIKTSAAKKSSMQVVITDANGRQVQKIAYQLIAGSNRFTVNMAGLAAGSYQITGYTDEGKLQTIKFIKQ